MEEITFADTLTHYWLKLKEASDEVEAMKNLVKMAESHIDSGWVGTAADTCRLKLDTVQNELTRTLTEISEALIKLSAIGEALAEDEILLV